MEREIFIIAEHREGQICSEALELAGFAQKLAEATGESLAGVILGCPVRPLAEQFAQATGLKVIGLEHKHLGFYNAESYVRALKIFLAEQNPSRVLITHSATGWDFAPRLAVALSGSYSAGVVGFQTSPELCYLRWIYGGRLMAEVAPIPDKVSVLTVLPGTGKAVSAEKPGEVEIRKIEIPEPRTRNLGAVESKRGTLDLTKAEVIVAVGRGIGKPENLELIKKLASHFEKSGIGASRPVVDAGWLPYEHQVGQTGQTVKPKVYFAIGISGALQHLVGMKDSELIVAINQDRNANIFRVAQIGIVQDLHQFLPVLIEKIQQKKT